MSEISLAELSKLRKTTASEDTSLSVQSAETKPDFTDEEKTKIVEIKKGIDFLDSNSTTQYGNDILISTFEETIKIQSEGRQQRAEAEKALVQIEDKLKNKLIEIMVS